MYAAASKRLNGDVRRRTNKSQRTAKPSKKIRLDTHIDGPHDPPEQSPVVGSSENARNRYFGQYGTWRAQNLKKRFFAMGIIMIRCQIDRKVRRRREKIELR